jgi:alpha-1,6-mannosyltransferase
VSPEVLAPPRDGTRERPRLRVLPRPPLRVVDVARLPRDRRAGLRAYLEAKARYAAQTGAFEHHVLSPRADGLQGALLGLEADVVLFHDPFAWAATDVVGAARAGGARVVAVHHGPGAAALRSWRRRCALQVDAVMANRDTMVDCGRRATLTLGFGVDQAFGPQARVGRADHVLYVGRLSRRKGVLELLEAAARSADPWPLRLVGSGPLESTLRRRARRLGIATRLSILPPVGDRARLARHYAQARCVVVPGEFEVAGLPALEAAACGTPVVACSTAPALRALGPLGHRFVPADPADLDRAIAGARAAAPEPEAAAHLRARRAWDRVFADEVRALRELVA